MASTDQQDVPQGSNTNLFVNHLPVTYDDDNLKQLFQPYGQIVSLKVIHDKNTQKSMGYGFVKFQTPDEAMAAINALNGNQIEDQQLHVSVARPSFDKNSNVYIAGLETHFTTDDLVTHFRVYGNIIESRILSDQSGNSKGVGFVRYETSQQANVACQALNGVTLAGTTKALQVRIAEKKGKQQQSGYNQFRGGMSGGNMRYNPMGMYQNQMGYQQYGPPGGPGGPMGGPGYGPPPAQSYGAPPMGYMAPPQAGAPGGNHAVDPNAIVLFVFNLPPETDEAYLYQMFSPYGAIASVKVVRNPQTQMCKGYSFVNMREASEAEAAIQALNGAQLGNKILQVSYKKDK